MAALRRRGLKVAPFKVGPDFIDPGHHRRITGVASRNLDGWMLSKTYNLETFARCTEKADLAVVEGVMGLFDGYDGKSDAGSTAQMAKWLGLPVVLLVDAKSMARSVAPLVMGFEHFDKKLKYAGVLFNNLGSDRHLKYLKDAIQGKVGMPCLGGIRRNEAIAMPERHLGLVTSEDHPLEEKTVDRLAHLIEGSINLDQLIKNLPNDSPPVRTGQLFESDVAKIVRIGVARDQAFCFYYQDNLDLLKRQGAELAGFSPIVDKKLPEEIDGLYLGGGYPELFAAKLADNAALREQIKEKSDQGMPIYGECGGFMYLCQELYDQKGNRYPMVGCFPFATKMFPRLKALGYREITLTAETVIGKKGQTMRGHEFHYSELTTFASKTATAYRISDRAGMEKAPDGYWVNQTLGSYNHLHFGSQPQAGRHFVENCLKYRQKRKKFNETRGNRNLKL